MHRVLNNEEISRRPKRLRNFAALWSTQWQAWKSCLCIEYELNDSQSPYHGSRCNPYKKDRGLETGTYDQYRYYFLTESIE